LTIVAQGSVTTHSGAHDLLDQVRKSLQNILASAGKDIVCDNTNCIKERRDAVDTNESATYENQRDSADTEDRLFNWTKQTEQIRKEISLLAKVPEDTVRETSSIFELGLDSIDVIKLSSRLKKQGIEIPVSAIIKSQTIANMAAKISTKNSWNSKASSGKSIREISDDLTAYLKSNGKLPSNAAAVLPATPLQQSMVNEMIKSNYEMYFNVEALKLSDNINPEKLMVAIERVIDQSPVLRTTFIEIEDPRSAVSYAQVVHNSDETANLSIATQVLRDGQNFEAFIDEFKANAAASAAANNKLLQLRFVSVGGARYLVVAISHALYDGRSLHILHEDIFKAYHEELSPRPEFMPFLDQVFQSTTDKAKGFWRTTLSNLPSAIFPRKDSSEVTNPSTVHRLEARSRIPLKDIEALCKASRITLQTLGQTCWALVLSHLMGQLDVVFGSVLSCRDSEEANEVMFPLMNTVAIRSVLHGSLNELLKYMQEMSDTTREYQHFPLATAQAYALASRENQSGATDTTLFDTLFIYQGRRAAPESDPIYESVYGASDVEFPVCVEMEIVDDKYLSWTTACKSIARDASETEQIIEALETVLERIISNPEAQTIASDADDVSVCGLPKFKRSETESKPAPPQLVNGTVDEDDWSSTEISIRKTLCEVSIVPEDQIRKDSTIFHLGLDSILVLKLPALLRSYGVNLCVSDILKEQTVYSMARAALRASPEKQEALDVDAVLAKATSSIDISARLSGLERKAGMIQEILPVTAGQKFMIRRWQISQGTLFFPTFTYSLPGRVNKARLDSAWRRLLQRHDILRTAFVETGNEIVQVVFSHPHNDVVYRANTSQPMRRRRDLEFPPLNLMLEETEGKPAKLELVIHHALYDGISLPILIEELQSLYRGHVLKKPDLFFRTFLAQSISAASSRTQDKWTSYLENETLYPAPATDDGTFKDNQRTEVFHPSMELSNMKQLAQDSGVSVDALFLAAVAKIYAWRLSQDSLAELVTEAVFGIYLANRAPFGEDLSLLTAPTLNLLPLRVLEPMKRSISSLAKDIQRDLQNISSADMACASLREIYEWTGVRVNFFANILKDTTPQINVYDGDNVKDMALQPVQDLSNRAQIVDETPNWRISIPSDGRCDAYLASSPSSPDQITIH
jgi:aryl carrier-like protein